MHGVRLWLCLPLVFFSLLIDPSILGIQWSILPASFPDWSKIVIGVTLTSIAWLVTTFVTEAEDEETLITFYKKTKPGGPGWKKIVDAAQNKGEDITTGGKSWDVPKGILAMLIGCVMVYSTLFATGNWLYGNTGFSIDFNCFGYCIWIRA